MVESSVALVIAIDGPAGAGKSSVARLLARRLGVFLLDTGAIYRALALVGREAKVDWGDGPGLARLAERLPVRFVPQGEGQAVFLGDRDVSAAIRTPEISEGASRVSAHPEVRAALLGLQRSLARSGGCVVEGRDIGSVVLPFAPVKFFVTASDEVRAGRRHAELLAKGIPSDLAQTLVEIRERDRRDSTRAAAPLKQAEDALLIDTSRMTIEEVVDLLERTSRGKLGG
jgi:CMP/dCMP kinase